MREAVGSTFLFKLMIVFIFFFASFLAIAINYSQAFRIKNSIINALEQSEGYNDTSIPRIENLVRNSGYHRSGRGCDRYDDSMTPEPEFVQPPNANGVCVAGIKTGDSIYYQVKTFISFDFPIIGNLFTFDVTGETKVITNPMDSTSWPD